MRIGGLCSGVGMLEAAVADVFGAELAWVSEVDKAASEVLATRLPDVPNIGDIKEVALENLEQVDIICAGFP